MLYGLRRQYLCNVLTPIASASLKVGDVDLTASLKVSDVDLTAARNHAQHFKAIG